MLSRLLLLPKKKKKKLSDYASFNNRLLALTIDMLIIWSILIYFMPITSGWFYNEETLSSLTQASALTEQYLQERLQNKNQMSMSEILAPMLEAGLVQKWTTDTLTQVFFGAILVLFFWVRWDATPGMWLFKMKVVNADDWGRPTITQYVMRFLVSLISLLPFMLGFWWIIFTPRRQAWQDIAARTLVINRKSLTAPVEGPPNPPAKPLPETDDDADSGGWKYATENEAEEETKKDTLEKTETQEGEQENHKDSNKAPRE